MKRLPHRRKGYGLFLVIMALALVGIAMILMTDISGTMSFQTQQAKVTADSDNLQAGALDWAAHNAATLKQSIGKAVALDCASLEISGAAASVTPVETVGKQLRIRIETCCNQGKHTIRKHTQHLIDLP
jgi:hypothetical protein